MSELALTLVAGSPARNSGIPKIADVVGNLYVGRVGVWEFFNLTPGPDAPLPKVRIDSDGDPAEILAGVALAGGLPDASETAVRVIGAGWHALTRGANLPMKAVQPLAECARKVAVGIVITGFTENSMGRELGQSLAQEGWSVLVTEPVVNALQSQFG